MIEAADVVAEEEVQAVDAAVGEEVKFLLRARLGVNVVYALRSRAAAEERKKR